MFLGPRRASNRRYLFLPLMLLALAGGLSLAGCRSSGVALNPPGSGSAPQQIAVGSCTPCAKANGQTTSTAPATVDLFQPGSTSSTGTLTTGIALPWVGAVFDSTGDLFVANCQSCFTGQAGTDNVVEYPRGATSPSVTIAVNSNSEPFALAIDSANTLYLSSLLLNGPPSAVTEYAQGYTSGPPTRSITVDEPTGIAIDPAGNLYVANCEVCNPSYFHTGADQILVYAPGTTSPMRTITAGVNEPVALAVDSAGTLYVANCNCGINGAPGGSDTVTEYANGGTTLTRTVSGLTTPFAIAVDTADSLYVANYGSNSVTKYLQGNTTPALTITTGLNAPGAVALDKNGTLYVSNTAGTTVSEYASTYVTGPPTATLSVQYPDVIAIR
jgi:hypothetical protein